MILLLLGGFISLVSALAGIFFQHWLEMQKLTKQSRQHLAHAVYKKQMEFFDKLAFVLPDINIYITTIDVWLGERTKDAAERVKTAAENTSSLTKLQELLDQYYMYLPKKLVDKANGLFSECLMLSNSPTMKHTSHCMDIFFAFQNEIRVSVGVDRLSEDLLKVFGARRRKRDLSTEG